MSLIPLWRQTLPTSGQAALSPDIHPTAGAATPLLVVGPGSHEWLATGLDVADGDLGVPSWVAGPPPVGDQTRWRALTQEVIDEATQHSITRGAGPGVAGVLIVALDGLTSDDQHPQQAAAAAACLVRALRDAGMARLWVVGVCTSLDGIAPEVLRSFRAGIVLPGGPDPASGIDWGLPEATRWVPVTAPEGTWTSAA